MAKIQAGQVVDLVVMSQAEAKVGDFKWSGLEEIAFNDEHLGLWKKCNGQSCLGTTYSSMTGRSTVPDATTDGSFIRQAKVGRDIGTNESQDFKSHTHAQDAHTHIQNAHNHQQLITTAGGAGYQHGSGAVNGNQIYSASYVTTSTTAVNQNTTAVNQNSGGIETRPNNIALNLYVKVSY